MLDDIHFPMNNIMYGGLISAVSLPNLIIPLFGGSLLDTRGHDAVMFFLLCTVVGQTIFTVAMMQHSYWLALSGRFLFGIGEGSVIVGTRCIVAHWFEKHELTFAMGATVAMANVSKMMAKATVAPVALYFHNYIIAFWYSVLVCLFSVGTGLVVLSSTRHGHKSVTERENSIVEEETSLAERSEWQDRVKSITDHNAKVEAHAVKWHSWRAFSFQVKV